MAVKNKKLHHLPPREVAEELTLMDAELLRKIQPSELEDGAWMDKTKVKRSKTPYYYYTTVYLLHSLPDPFIPHRSPSRAEKKKRSSGNLRRVLNCS